MLREYKILFNETLREDYPSSEIGSLFHILTEAFLGISRLDIALNPETKLDQEEVKKFKEALERLQNHEPVQYIVGETEFYGLKFKVNKNVLIPRPETEELVEWVIEEVRKSPSKNLKILDVGTGSGCIAVSLAKNLPKATISAIDVSEEALRIARENAQLNQVSVRFLQLDILKTKQLGENYDIIVSNPPYVRENEKAKMERNVFENEPSLALWVKDEDPLLFYEAITALAREGLTPNGSLYFEINEAFGQETQQLLSKNNFSPRLKRDIFGKDRMLKGDLLSE